MIEIFQAWDSDKQFWAALCTLFALLTAFNFLVGKLAIIIRGYPPQEDSADVEEKSP